MWTSANPHRALRSSGGHQRSPTCRPRAQRARPAQRLVRSRHPYRYVGAVIEARSDDLERSARSGCWLSLAAVVHSPRPTARRSVASVMRPPPSSYRPTAGLAHWRSCRSWNCENPMGSPTWMTSLARRGCRGSPPRTRHRWFRCIYLIAVDPSLRLPTLFTRRCGLWHGQQRSGS